METNITDVPNSCPTTEQLKALIDGLLPADEQLPIQAHVDSCQSCQSALGSLVAGGASWDVAVHHLKQDSPQAEEAVLSDAIERMKADPFDETSSYSSGKVDPLDFLTPSDQPGSIGKLGQYEVTEVVGHGGMGIVLKAFDPALHRVVAVKVLAPYLAHSPQARKRFIREAQAIAAVSHEHVITIHSIDDSAEQPKIVMQYIPGRSLQQRLDAEGSLDLKEILRIGMQTASGLAAAHAQGLVHRDVKPSNILLENGIQRVKLTDFGLARAVDDASLTQSGVIAGTPQYMAPEQANGDAVDFHADLFSLGSVLYAMCVGHSPFRASTMMGVLKRVCHDPPRPIQELNPDIPNWLCAIVTKLLAKKPENRFSSAKEVAELLEKWLAHVQQPQVASRPPLGDTERTSADSSPSVLWRHAAEQVASGIEQEFKGVQDVSQSILFQRISLRLFLVIYLISAVVLMPVTLLRTANLGESIAVSVMGGLLTAFWATAIIAVSRFLWANFRKISPSTKNHSPPASTNKAQPHPTDAMYDTSSNRTEETPPLSSDESIATPETGAQKQRNNTMAATFPLWILALLLVGVIVLRSGNLQQLPGMHMGRVSSGPGLMMFATVGLSGFLILVLLRYAWPTVRQTDQETASALDTSNTSEGQNVTSGFLQSLIDWTKDVFRWTLEFLQNTLSSIKSFPWLWIGWYLVGGFDLVLSLIVLLNTQAPVWIPLMWMSMSVMSFVVSHCIYVRQNLFLVRLLAFLGLVPASFGAIVRIPLSIITLIWQIYPSTHETFEKTPWPETQLGRLVSTYLSPLVGR